MLHSFENLSFLSQNFSSEYLDVISILLERERERERERESYKTKLPEKHFPGNYIFGELSCLYIRKGEHPPAFCLK